MPIQPVLRTTNQQLQPYYYPEQARTLAVNLVPGTYVAGQALGRFTSSAVNEVQTLTATGTVSGGTYSLALDGLTIFSGAYNASVATIQAAINAALGSGQITVGGGAFPGTPLTFTVASGGIYAGTDIPLITVTSAVTGGGSIAMAQTTAGVPGPGKYGAYVDANSDGTGVFVGFLKYACTVANDGRILIGYNQDNAPGLELTAPIYVGGYFHTADVTGFDAAALADVYGHFVEGTLAAGGVFTF
jgi:hypothetical protein